MAAGHSFAEYVKDKCYNGLYKAAEEYVNENWEPLNLYTRNVHRSGCCRDGGRFGSACRCL